MKGRTCVVIVVALAIAVLFAQVPRTMSYSGKITGPTGLGIIGPHDMAFLIYDAPIGGTSLWSEGHPGVIIERGLFSVILGQTVPLNLAFDVPYWLEIIVDDSVFSPRAELTSGPYAFRALFADSVTSAGDDGDWSRTGNLIYPANASDSVGIGTVFPSAMLDVVGDARIDGDLEVTGIIDPIAIIYQPQTVPPLPAIQGKVYYNDTFNELMLYDSTSWVPLGGGAGGGFEKLRADAGLWLNDSVTFISGTNIVMTQNNDSITIAAIGGAGDSDWNVVGDNMNAVPTGNVGIGIFTPLTKLHVVEGDTFDIFRASLPGDLKFIVKNNGNVGINVTNPGAKLHIEETDTMDPLFVRVSANPHFVVKNDGRIGINRSDPSAKLHISEDDTLDLISAGVAGDSRLIVKNDGNVGIGTNIPTARLYVADDDSTDLFRAVKSGSTKFIVDDDGHVGISTATPSCKLHVNCGYGFVKADQSEGEIFETHYEGGGTGQALKASLGATTYALLGYDCISGTYAGYFDGKVYIDGRVGIGTLDPQYGVHYVGNAALTTICIVPDTTPSGGDSKILLGEDDDFTYGMGIKYEGEENYLFIYGKNNTDINSNLFTVERDSGRIGIGTADPEAVFHIKGGTTYDPFIAKSNGSIRLIVKSNGYVGVGVDDPQARLDVFHKIQVSDATGDAVVEIGEGLDYAEGFDVSNNDAIEPGMVLVIDPDNPGKLLMSANPYDSKVAGIVAGAKSLGSGVRLGSATEFDHNVALAGRVYCFADATDEGIEPGDLLTTSATPGYAMKATDYRRAQGAIIGKAMETLERGKKGQILVLVTLQ